MTRQSKTLVACVVVLTIGGICATPYFFRSIGNTCCVCQLQQMEGAKTQWALQFQKSTNEVPSLADLQPIVFPGRPEKPLVFRCRDGGKYTIGSIGEKPTCSIGGLEHSLP